ncbi:hypothetical protein, partial [Neobacillus drentensis]|uniref:hypothetical protein n=1 Tax=Neobacillus drentensis TaxID=220684 RepID=UPI002FFE079B
IYLFDVQLLFEYVLRWECEIGLIEPGFTENGIRQCENIGFKTKIIGYHWSNRSRKNKVKYRNGQTL